MRLSATLFPFGRARFDDVRSSWTVPGEEPTWIP